MKSVKGRASLDDEFGEEDIVHFHVLGVVLGIVESFAGQFFGPQHALTVGFALMLVLLVVKPTGLTGIKGYE